MGHAAEKEQPFGEAKRRVAKVVGRIGPSPQTQGLVPASLGAVEGAPGSWQAVGIATGIRAVVIGGVLYALPSRGSFGTVALQAIAVSVAVSLFSLVSQAVRRRA